jgi:branched-chain amino acid aminotransferase
LLIADEMAICGTLAELPLVKSIEGQPMPEGSPLLTALQKRLLDAVRGVDPHPEVELTMLPMPDGSRHRKSASSKLSVSR